MANQARNSNPEEERWQLKPAREVPAQNAIQAPSGYAWWWIWIVIIIVVFAWLLGWGW